MNDNLVGQVHKDVRHLARRAAENGAELVARGGYVIDVHYNGERVTSLPTRRGRGKPGNIKEYERKLREAGLLAQAKTKVAAAFEEARARVTADVTIVKIEEAVEPEDKGAEPHIEPVRSEREPAGVGVIDASTRSRAPQPVRGRYYSQAEWAARVRRRFEKMLKDGRIADLEEFVEYAIVVAQQRALDPPNFRGARDPWDVTRIYKNVCNFLGGTAPRSRTLTFLETALDDIDGLLNPIPKVAPPEEPQLEPEAAGTVLPPEVEVVLTTRSGEVLDRKRVLREEGIEVFEKSSPPVPSDLRDQYAAILVSRLANDQNPSKELLDRIERVLGLIEGEDPDA